MRVKALDNITQFIKDHDRFVITSHARPDGDAIGSELGLALMLEKLGKTAHIFNADPHPRLSGWQASYLPKERSVPPAGS